LRPFFQDVQSGKTTDTFYQNNELNLRERAKFPWRGDDTQSCTIFVVTFLSVTAVSMGRTLPMGIDRYWQQGTLGPLYGLTIAIFAYD